ncbi:MAG: carbohydrate-binding domain-containing protein, partial [Firmicutes bacterium]|nr:carbohydrate-binding domain-containing protein [Bacillota bacterium]
DVDTAAAGANVIVADGSVNNIDGAYVARIYKDTGEEKKLHKYDAAFYSKMTMNVNGGDKGDGILNINASNEGLDSEMHLTINGGKINIASGNDGINTNEDNVSVTTINGGALHIVAGLGEEGDGIDSNGYLVINGGTVIAAAKPMSDSGLDADLGSYINGGTVIATGSTMDWAESDSEQVTMNLQFKEVQDPGEAIVITREDGIVVFAYDGNQDETTGDQFRGYQGAIISSPNLEVNKTYHVYVGGDVQGSDVDGLFDPDTVTKFNDAVKQEFTGTDVGMRGFGRGQRPEGQRPEGMEERPEDAPVMVSTEFYMTDKVNAFSGVCDEGTNSPF